MKKGLIPEISEQWWKKNKDWFQNNTGISAALREYEVAYNGGNTDYPRTLKSLEDLKKVVLKEIKNTSAAFHKNALDCLKKYPSVIDKEKAAIKKNWEAYKKNSASAGTEAPKQKVGAAVVIWERDVVERVRKAFKGKTLEIGGKGILRLKLNKDLLEVLETEGDRVTPAYMVEDAEALCTKLVADIVALCNKTEASVEKLPAEKADQLQAATAERINKAIAAYAKDIEKIPAKRWNEFAARRQQYKAYVVKAGLEIAVTGLSVAGGAIATGAAGAATMGAGAVLGVVQLVRGVMQLAQQIYDLAREAEGVGKQVGKDLKTLEKSYLTAQQTATKTMATSEITGTVLKSVLSADTPFYATLPKTQKNLDLFDNKVAGLETKAVSYSKAIVKAIDKADELEKQLLKADPKKAKKALQKLRAARKALDASLNACSGVSKRVRENKPKIKPFKDALGKLDEANPPFAKVFEKVVPVVVNLAIAGGSAGIGYSEAGTALDTVSTTLGLLNDVLGEVKGQLE